MQAGFTPSAFMVDKAMSDETPEIDEPEASPEEPKGPKLKPEEEMLNLKVQRPYLWFIPIAIPFLILAYITVTSGPRESKLLQADRPSPREIARQHAQAMDNAVMRLYGPEGQRSAYLKRRLGYDPAKLPDPAGFKCDFDLWVGRTLDRAIIESVDQSLRSYRIIRPGQVITKDFAPGRINFEVNGNDTITRIWCG